MHTYYFDYTSIVTLFNYGKMQCTVSTREKLSVDHWTLALNGRHFIYVAEAGGTASFVKIAEAEVKVVEEATGAANKKRQSPSTCREVGCTIDKSPIHQRPPDKTFICM